MDSCDIDGINAVILGVIRVMMGSVLLLRDSCG